MVLTLRAQFFYHNRLHFFHLFPFLRRRADDVAVISRLLARAILDRHSEKTLERCRWRGTVAIQPAELVFVAGRLGAAYGLSAVKLRASRSWRSCSGAADAAECCAR